MMRIKKLLPMLLFIILISSFFISGKTIIAVTEEVHSSKEFETFSNTDVIKNIDKRTYVIKNPVSISNEKLPDYPEERLLADTNKSESVLRDSGNIRSSMNGDRFVTNVSLKTTSNTEITNGNKLEYNTEYRLTYKWEIPNVDALGGETDIYFTIPREMIVDSPFSFPVNNSSGKTVGDAVVEGNNDTGYYIKMTLTSYGLSQDSLEGSFILITHVNETYVDEGKATIEFPNNPLDVEFPSQGGGGGDGTGAGSQTNLKKSGKLEFSAQGGRHAKWEVILGYDAIMGVPINGNPENGYEKRFDSFNEIESIMLYDEPHNQKLIDLEQGWGWNGYSAYYAYNKMFWPNYPWDYDALRYDKINLISRGGDYVGVDTDLKINMDNLIRNQTGPFNDYRFEYLTVPLDPTVDQELTNKATVTIKGKDKSEVEYVLESVVMWSTGGGIADGTTGRVKLIKSDIDDSKIKLEDAEFDLYKIVDGEWKEENINLVTNSKGEILVSNLKSGKYVFVETSAPPGYELPEGEDANFYFDITKEDIKDEITVEVNVKNERVPDRELTFIKYDESGNVIKQSDTSKQAKFQLEKQDRSSWSEVKNHVYQVDSNGSFMLDESDFSGLEVDKTYRFKEIKAPYGYELPKGNDAYSDTFYLEKYKVTPEEISMNNKKLNHQIKFQKTIEFNTSQNSPTSSEGIKFVIQGRNNGDWERYSNETFVTDKNGMILIDNTTHPDFIQGMVDSNFKQFRFRESEVPPGRGLADPQYPTTGKEKDGPPGSNFSVAIPIDKLRTGTNEGKNVEVSDLKLENKLIRYKITLEKIDSINKKLLNGAEFLLYEEGQSEQNGQVIKGNNGVFEINDLVIGKKYVIKESKAPDGYSPKNVEYHIQLDLNKKMHVSTTDESNKKIDLVEGKDYTWDGTKLEFKMKIENSAMPKMPMTGGIGMTWYTLSSLAFLLVGSILFMINKKGEIRHGKRKK